MGFIVFQRGCLSLYHLVLILEFVATWTPKMTLCQVDLLLESFRGVGTLKTLECCACPLLGTRVQIWDFVKDECSPMEYWKARAMCKKSEELMCKKSEELSKLESEIGRNF